MYLEIILYFLFFENNLMYSLLITFVKNEDTIYNLPFTFYNESGEK
jgi:hypothetical protein